jgi:hypothetical protein
MAEMAPWQVEDTTGFELHGLFGMDFEVSVALPPGHAAAPPGQRWPALLVLDAPAAFTTAVATARIQYALRAVEPIVVVGLSTPRREGPQMLGLNRLRYLTPGAPPESSPDVSLVLKLMAEPMRAKGWGFRDCFGGAAELLAFIGEVLRPELALRWPIDTGKLGLFGHSTAGAFAAFSLLEDTRVFDRYIVGTFGTQWWRDVAAHESAFVAARRAASPARSTRVYHAVGGAEIDDPAFAHAGLGLPLMQRLAAMGLPGLEVSTQVFEGENHGSVIAHVLATGIRTLYGTGHDFGAGLKARLDEGA